MRSVERAGIFSPCIKRFRTFWAGPTFPKHATIGTMTTAPLQFLFPLFAGWVNRRQLAMIDDLKEENRVLLEQLGTRRLRFTDDQRRRLAEKGRVPGRRVLDELAGLVTPDTILRWYRELIARKYDGPPRRGTGRSAGALSVRQLVADSPRTSRAGATRRRAAGAT